MLQVEGLQMDRGARRVLDIPSLAVAAGEVVAVMGPNGAGKSSLLQALALLAPARFAAYAFAGRPARLPGDALALRRQMALVLQEPLLLEGTVLANAAAGLRLRGVPAAQARERAQAWLARLGVVHLAGRHASQLSGGEAQRVSLARALALAPRLLLLDEPFAALDALTRVALLRDLRPVLRAGGMAALLVTHDLAEVALLADRVLVLEGGRLVQAGALADVLARPATPAVCSLVAHAAEVTGALAPLLGGAAAGVTGEGAAGGAGEPAAPAGSR